MPIPDRLRSWRPDRLVTAAWALAVLPVVVAAMRAIRRGWLPIGDNALVAIRAQDVLTSHHPWLGTWSSASLDAGKDLNHPGPLLFDSVAPTVKLFGGHTGLVLGVMVVNVLAVTTVAVFAWRRGGRITALPMLLGAAVLGFIMGSELLFDPWNPHILILPCLALLVCAWGVAAGDRWAFLVFVAIGSYAMQTHLGYAYLVPGLLVLSFAVGWIARRAVPDSLPTLWPARRTWLLGVGVVLVLWSQPLIEQFFGAGEGNLSRILGARGSKGPKIGVHLATRLLASVITWAPWSLRRGFVDAVPRSPYSSPGALAPMDLIGGLAALALLGLVGLLIVGLAVVARRRRDTVSLLALGTVVAAVVLAYGSMIVMPIGPLGLTPHQMRWLWPITVFLWSTVLCVACRLLLRNDSQHRAVDWAMLALTGLVAIGNLPSYVQAAGPASRADLIPSVAVLDAQLAPLEGIGTIFFDTSNTPLLDNYTAAIMAELQRRDVPFLVSDSGLVRQLGNARQYHPGDAKVRLQLLFGLDAVMVPDGRDRVALYTPLTRAELDELDALHSRITAGEFVGKADTDRYAALAGAAQNGSVAVVISAAT